MKIDSKPCCGRFGPWFQKVWSSLNFLFRSEPFKNYFQLVVAVQRWYATNSLKTLMRFFLTNDISMIRWLKKHNQNIIVFKPEKNLLRFYTKTSTTAWFSYKIHINKSNVLKMTQSYKDDDNHTSVPPF